MPPRVSAFHCWKKMYAGLAGNCKNCWIKSQQGNTMLGKSYLSAVFCVTRAILYPGSKIVIASGTRSQSLNVLNKIMLELKPLSPALAFEISEKETKINGTDAQIVFKNGSFIKVVTSGESARGNRANILIIDEFRLVPKDTVDTILSKFLTSNRMPEYSELSKEERRIAREKEANKTLYLSSAYFSDSWAFEKCRSLYDLMQDDTKRSFVCGFPYQLAIKEGLLSVESVKDQMAESDFSEIKWSIKFLCSLNLLNLLLAGCVTDRNM